MTREHFFVTGALGCIGTWVVQNLLNDGAAVTVFDLAKDVRRWRLLMDDATIARVNLVQGDITQTETVLCGGDGTRPTSSAYRLKCPSAAIRHRRGVN